MAIQLDPTNLADSAADDASQELYINTAAKTLKVVAVGGIVDTGQQSENGVAIKCVYSFLKEQWTADPNTKNLAAFPFPMVPITDEFFELVDGWTWANTTTEGLLRNGGWLVRNTAGNVIEHWAGIKTTGSTEADDQLYYQLSGTSGTAAAADFLDVGAVNQGVQVIDDPNGDANYADGFSYCTNIKVFNRQYNQIYSVSSTSANGEASLTAPKIFGLDASTTADLNIEDVDGNMTASPYSDIKVRYFDQVYSRDVDSATNRSFGIVVDVKTHSGVDGSAPGGASVLTTAEAGMTVSAFAGGTLVIHEGTDEATIFPITDNAAGTVTVTGTIAVGSNMSFTAYPATASMATAEQIYTKVQYLLRQNSDIDATDGAVTGKVGDQILTFVGSDLKAGSLAPTNPNGGGSGVCIEGFKASDTNRITFYDNSAVTRTFPYVASLTINFGANLQNDASAEYWVYFTNDDAGDNLGYDWGTANAIIVDDNSGVDMAGSVSAAASVEKSFNYDGNVQRGAASAGDDAPITVIGIGLATGQYVKTTGTISRSTSNVVSLIAALERNYSNP
jgi:hypothetical protein